MKKTINKANQHMKSNRGNRETLGLNSFVLIEDTLKYVLLQLNLVIKSIDGFRPIVGFYIRDKAKRFIDCRTFLRHISIACGNLRSKYWNRQLI